MPARFSGSVTGFSLKADKDGNPILKFTAQVDVDGDIVRQLAAVTGRDVVFVIDSAQPGLFDNVEVEAGLYPPEEPPPDDGGPSGTVVELDKRRR